MSNQDPVRVFIGSGEASLLERKTLIHSIRKNSQRDLDIWVYNGTHNSIERNDEPPYLASLPLHLKYRNYTEFSLYRYMIPELCNFEGKAIYLDSDMICLGDIGELFDTPTNGNDFLAISAYAGEEWGTSVMLIDCSQCRFDLEQIFKEIDEGLYSYFEFSRMSPKFRQHHPYKIGELDPNWNVFDRRDENTKLIHYTELLTQPWKYPHHPYGELWFQNFREAIDAGLISDWDITLSVMRSTVRTNIREGNSPAQPSKVLTGAKKLAKKILKRNAA